MTPELRIRLLNSASPDASGDFVLYWMIANRRPVWNFSLQRAVEWARDTGKPLVVLEALRCDYQWASDRLHRFVLQGMSDNRDFITQAGATYIPFVEPDPGAGRGLLETLAARAAVVITDDFPCFFLPGMLSKVAARLPVRCEAIDSNGLLPLRATESVFPTAHSFRRFLQKNLLGHLADIPLAEPLAGLKSKPLKSLASDIANQWPGPPDDLLAATPAALAKLPIDHRVGPAAFDGGLSVGSRVLASFIESRLPRYGEDRNQPDADASSGLSPYLHFGHVSAHQVFAAIAEREEWSPADVSDASRGARAGWWQMSPESESFLDELITWRELGFNLCSHRTDYDQYESLPEWAQKTLAKHARDVRPVVYSPEELAAAATHDDIWNAAQRQLVIEGRMHNYLRMLWGKKILEWSESPRAALATMIELNNRFAVDGRNPNSYSGIFWCLGRYDRAWGPERNIFGTIRYMSSESTARKLKLKNYLKSFGRFGGSTANRLLFLESQDD